MARDRFGFLNRHGLWDDYGSNDMAARTLLITTTATVEAIRTTAFPSPSTTSNATVFHGVLLGRLKLSDIDSFLWSVDASMPSSSRRLRGATIASANF